MGYVLHITNKNYSSWSLRPWVLMRALGIGFDEVLHPYHEAGAQDFRRAAPAGKVPWLVDGETVVWEPSRGGQLFPHIYGPLPVAAVTARSLFRVDAEGAIHEEGAA